MHFFIPYVPRSNSEHSSRRAKRVANEVSSTVENMIKEKQHTTIYTFSRNRSDQFSSFFFPEVVTGTWQNWLGRTWLYRFSQNLGPTIKRHEVTRKECQQVSRTYFADYFYHLLLIYIHFLCTDIHSLMMLWRTFEEITDRSVLCSHLG